MAHKHVKELTGVVLSNKMEKTAVVQVTRHMQHPLYGKVIKRHKKYVAHDEKNATKIGDRVQIQETRPLSKTKRWRIMQVLKTV